MKTSPKSCNKCNHRFICYTEREDLTNTEVSSGDIPKLSEILKEIQAKF